MLESNHKTIQIIYSVNCDWSAQCPKVGNMNNAKYDRGIHLLGCVYMCVCLDLCQCVCVCHYGNCLAIGFSCLVFNIQ